ncbi:hypothetical protein SO802_002674 [Lithocarpus litseifolius]|uniref:Uncharacterized protein n=1 Tax=Lithocarpus litseifolius TaxID=425828 RepID=A0AAW2E1X3_9ROSI
MNTRTSSYPSLCQNAFGTPYDFFVITGLKLTPYDFFVITGLKLGGGRIRVHDSLSTSEIKKLLGVMPSKMRSKNVPLSWLCENITKCDTVARGQSTHQMSLAQSGVFLNFLVPCPYFFLACWMAHDLGRFLLQVDVDLMEESMQTIGGLQLLVSQVEVADSARRTLEDRNRNLELENRQYDPRFYASQEGNTEGSSSRVGLRRSSRRQT